MPSWSPIDRPPSFCRLIGYTRLTSRPLTEAGIDEQLRQSVLGSQGADHRDVASRVRRPPRGGECFDEQQAGLKGCQRASGRVNSGEQSAGMPTGLFAVIRGVASREQADSGGRVQLGCDGGDAIAVMRNAAHGPTFGILRASRPRVSVT